MSLSEDASQAARNATMLLVFVFKIDRTDDCYVQRELRGWQSHGDVIKGNFGDVLRGVIEGETG